MRTKPFTRKIQVMNVSDESTASRQFVASAEAFSTGWIKGTKVFQAVYSVFFVAFVGFAALAVFRTSKGIPVHVPRYTGLIFMAVLLVASVVIGAYLFWRSRQKYVLTVNGDALTVGPRGDVYSLADAQLGLWPNVGVALHLRSGSRSFVLGGRDRRIGPSTPLDAAPIQVVDARLPASDFDELLRLGGRAAACGPARGEPTRCILFPNSQTIANSGPFAFRKKQRLVNSLGREQLFIDVNNDTIRVVDPESHTVNATAPVSRVTATPLSYETRDAESGRVSRTPAVAMSVAGVPPLTFGCPHIDSSGRRFSWSGSVLIVNEPPAYILSAADWLALVEVLGLATDLNNAARKG
jgi:hypothetical protein